MIEVTISQLRQRVEILKEKDVILGQGEVLAGGGGLAFALIQKNNGTSWKRHRKKTEGDYMEETERRWKEIKSVERTGRGK